MALLRNLSRRRLVLLIFLTLFVIAGSFDSLALEEFSLNSKLSLSATPMPCTLSEEIESETPCERAFLKWDIKSIIDLDVKFGNTDYFLDTALSISHPEHLVLGLQSDVGGFTLRPEIWFAAPFESITDVNNMYNSVVIPPGDPLFVTARLTTTYNVGSFRFKNLFMYEDVNFPGYSFDGMEYTAQSQSFKVGDILYLSGRLENGISISSRTSFCADASTSVKNYSASGGVDPDCENEINERLSISGITIGPVRLYESINIDIKDDTTVSSRTGISFSVFDWSRFSTSLSVDIIPLDIEMGSISVGLSADPFRLNMSFSELQEPKFNAVTGSFRERFKVGLINGSFSANATVQGDKGLTAVSMSLFVSQGTVSSSHSLSFSRWDDRFQFSYLNNRINLRLSPFTFTASPSFNSNGLRRLAISTGVMF